MAGFSRYPSQRAARCVLVMEKGFVSTATEGSNLDVNTEKTFKRSDQTVVNI